MFKFPISSEAEPGWLEWLVCPDCQVWCHNSTGLGREGAGRHHPCLHLHPPGAHCTPHLTAPQHWSSVGSTATPRTGLRGRCCPAVVAGWRGGQVCPLCGAAGAQVTSSS